MIYLWPAEGAREYLTAHLPAMTRHDLLIVPSTWEKAIAHMLIDRAYPDPAQRITIRVADPRRPRNLAYNLVRHVANALPPAIEL